VKGSVALEQLQRLLTDAAQLHTKLILLAGGTPEERIALFDALHESLHSNPLHLGVSLASALAELPQRERHLQVGNLLREIAQSLASTGPLLIEGVELLFDASLKVNALDLLRRQSLARPVVAVWPGEWRNGRLTYAVLGNPEYQDHAADGVIVYEI
jgi:hypothetical protein